MAPGYNKGTVYVSTVPGTRRRSMKATARRSCGRSTPKRERRSGSANRSRRTYGPTRTHEHQLRRRPVGPTDLRPGRQPLRRRRQPRARCPGTKPSSRWARADPGRTSTRTRSSSSTNKRASWIWYYQLTPHDISDHDLENSPILGSDNGTPIVIDGGKAGIVIAVNAETGKLVWKRPVGVHNGEDNSTSKSKRQSCRG